MYKFIHLYEILKDVNISISVMKIYNYDKYVKCGYYYVDPFIYA